MRNGQRHIFDEPVAVELPKYRSEHRVFGVKRCRNPNGLFGRKLFVYAIAEWRIGKGYKWHPVQDLVCQVRLANALEHAFPKNTEDYAW